MEPEATALTKDLAQAILLVRDREERVQTPADKEAA